MSGTTKQTIEVDVPDGRFAFAMTCDIEPDKWADHRIYWPSGFRTSYDHSTLAARGVVIPTPPRAFRKGDTVEHCHGGRRIVMDVLDDGKVLRIADGTVLGRLVLASDYTLHTAVDA